MDYKVTAWDASLIAAQEESVESDPLAPAFHVTSDSPLDAAIDVAKRSRYSEADPILYSIASPGGLPGEFFEHPALLAIYQVEALT